MFVLRNIILSFVFATYKKKTLYAAPIYTATATRRRIYVHVKRHKSVHKQITYA